MDAKQTTVGFLTRPENLPLAVEVFENFASVYDACERFFVGLLSEAIRPRLATSLFAAEWTLKQSLRDLGKMSGNRYSGINLIPRDPSSVFPHFVLYVSRESNEHYLYYGIEWGGGTGEEPNPLPPGISTKLSNFLNENEYERNKWTSGWKSYRNFADLKQFLVAIGSPEESKQLADGVAQDFWILFESTAQIVSEINRELAMK